jgi:hypothetical protein
MATYLWRASYSVEGVKGLTSLAVNAAGAVRLDTTLLLTPEEFDAASKKSVGYRPPGA